jgi:glutathione S-transferase
LTGKKEPLVPQATLTISSKNYSSWSLRGWLLCKFAGLAFKEQILPSDDPAMRAELLLLSPSFLVPRLINGSVTVWDTLAIAEYLNDIKPKAGLLPPSRAAAAHCRSICGEMHAGFSNLRSALPMNLKSRHPGFKVWPGAQADIDRIVTIWDDCLAAYGGPFLFGSRTMADAIYAPVATRFETYDVKLSGPAAGYAERLLEMPEMLEWRAAALAEDDELQELDAEF